ncbi:MAG TPA: hypothetical protein PLF71_02555, partial [bacterium]|nr:hypothetical protein [bacterium]
AQIKPMVDGSGGPKSSAGSSMGLICASTSSISGSAGAGSVEGGWIRSLPKMLAMERPGRTGDLG